MSQEENIALGAIPLDKSAVFLCDLQEKFRPAMLHYAAVVGNANKLVSSLSSFYEFVILKYSRKIGSVNSRSWPTTYCH